MIIYTDVFTDKECCSDAMPGVIEFDGLIRKVQAEEVTIDDTYKTADDEEEMDDAVHKVLNVVHNARLEKATMAKKDFKQWLGDFVKKLRKHIRTNNPDRLEAFLKAGQAFAEQVLAKFDEYEVYMLEDDYEREGQPVLCSWSEDGMTTYFHFWNDALKDVKV